MHFNLFHWLFDDPVTAANNANASTPEQFHYAIPWLVFCLAGLLITFYYSVEGRKRFIKSRPLLKYMLDRYLTWFAVICFVGLPMLGSRVFLDNVFFAWRFWRYLWLLSIVVWVVLWITYLIRKFPAERANYIAYQKRQQYVKPSRRKVRTATR